ncbi:protein-glutamate methylesterase/protein-glutamine glutaminase [Halalkalibacter urbisdiaboli]|uniref:protein-glutamate methylesterase/protein-glutamine glutaminase n=1 Tax=Halalkalibacter urbisdiaboli TaxID=1960589 RepID=UPI000B45350D|nr:chemotaxis response regulator protein-glutamate methylesterase [Halalkalibacter urbisdiaboli]
MEKNIRVLVVDDSAFMRKVIKDLLERNPQLHVVGTARNGQDALIKQKELCPDVITLDIEMPIMDGLETLKKIMDTNPCPVIMVSSTTKSGAHNTLLAMEYGAVDFVTKPSGPISLDLYTKEELIVEKVLLAAKVKVPKEHKVGTERRPMSQFIKRDRKQSMKKIVAIGTSTGGPKALKEVLTQIPATIEAPIVIVQHMPPGFTQSLALRLDSLSAISVKEATHGEVLKNGVAYIAPGGYHMQILEQGNVLKIEINKNEIRRGHRPSVDVLFESLANIPNTHKIAVIMTGMGSDGTEGLLQLKKGSCFAIAESQESAIVYGMPKTAIQTDLIDEISHLSRIASHIIRNC